MKQTWKHAHAALLLVIAPVIAGSTARAQVVTAQAGGIGIGAAIGAAVTGTPVTGAPYTATSSNESVQTLADGNRIVASSSGTIARDSSGRTRQDMPLPALGNLAAAYAPHLVFISDPTTHINYILNLTDKTAQKMDLPDVHAIVNDAVPAAAGPIFFARTGGAGGNDATSELPVPPPLPPMLPPPGAGIKIQLKDKIELKDAARSAPGQTVSEDLGSQTIEGVFVTGTRTTTTIPAGQIGNEQPIKIVSEIWTSPDLKVTVFSKRSDPRIGEQTYKLTNIARADPDPGLFTVPAGFTVSGGPQNVIYRTNQ